jgi:HD-like signal output (HDOD) protein
MVNSSFFALPGRIETVDRAVSLLGTRQVHDLALATSVAYSFSTDSRGVMDVPTFWRKSMFRGLVSRGLASAIGGLDSERLFIIGLLSDIGHLVMYQTVPELCRKAETAAKELEKPLYVAERELIGIDYARVGGVLMRQWQLPGSLREPTECHVEPRRAQEFPTETYLLHLASLLVSAADTGQEFDTGVLKPQTESWEMTGLSQQQCLSVQLECEAAADEAVHFFISEPKVANG